ncbi:SDR family oxidoreductase [Sphingomonas piscis]|uniref:SDR family oxidoreductase n=1 Tax=Sphingomonas piscis TaxID=2714943 RepID=A0A6G7YRX7_9SPHN|nr:SDR family oxidoreductase [Sphingomonas piscis]QIK79495.1 SDR family oxidoreductase [Sphingomonas piscis]
MRDEPRTAIVTGASKRVGAEIARALLAEGWQVVAHVRSEDDPVPEGAVRATAELSDYECAETIFRAAAELPAVRLLVNNASRFVFDSAEGFNPQEFDDHMAVNLRAPLLLASAFARRHRDGDGLIVNILDSKVAAPNPDFLSYTLSKQGLAAATGLLAQALAAQGMRVNAIAPALMLQSPGQTAENFRKMHAANPLSRGVEPADVVSALRYLLDAATVTGQILTVDGGHHFLRQDRDVQFLEGE